ncbi:major facilitator superfamily domain-containing protein [Melanogaster broomeanus]|nr:major facilitator superfamily domain-containing protein [Melanogaster broomeanus]
MSTAPPVTSQTPSDDSKKSTASPLKLTDQTNLLPFRKILAVVSGLALCVVLTVIDSVILATALPTISAAFNAGSVASWVPSAYMLTSTSFQPLYGRFSDIFGRKATLCVAMVVFMLGSLASGFSKSINELIVFYGVTGVGGGSVVSLMQIIVSDVVSLRDRGKYQGIVSAIVAVGYAIGPPLGGALSERVSWRWCFWIKIPVSLCATKLLAIDYLGTALTLLGSTLVILPLIWGGVTYPWNSPVVLVPLCSGVFVIFLFCWWEWKGAHLPIVPMYIFRHVTVTGVYIATFIIGFIFYSSLYYLPQFFQVALGYSPIQSGLFSLPVLVTQTLVSWVAGRIMSRTGRYRTMVYVGFSVWAIACGCLSTVTASTSKALLVFYMVLAGAGAGQTTQTSILAAQASVSSKDVSVVTAVRNFVRLLGGTLSLAVGSTLVNNSLRHILSRLPTSKSTSTAFLGFGSWCEDGATLAPWFPLPLLSNACHASARSLSSSPVNSFDKEGFSVWRVDFKYNEELAVAFRLSNQVRGFFNRLEASGGYLLSSVGVLGEPNASVISGALILRGQDVKAVVACAHDRERYVYKKLDLQSEDDKKFFEACLGSGD